MRVFLYWKIFRLWDLRHVQMSDMEPFLREWAIGTYELHHCFATTFIPAIGVNIATRSWVNQGLRDGAIEMSNTVIDRSIVLDMVTGGHFLLMVGWLVEVEREGKKKKG